MQPTIYFFGAAGLLLLLAVLAILLWDKFARPPKRLLGDGKPEGAFRGFYQALWVLLLWSVFVLYIPMWISFRVKVSGLETAARFMVVAKMLAPLVLFIFILIYGRRRGYLSWIESLHWPDKENK